MGLTVERRFNLCGTSVVFRALNRGDVDLYPEYTGTGLAIHLDREARVSDPLRVFLQVEEAFRERFDIVWLHPFGFNNTYALAVTKTVAHRRGLTTISDLLASDSDLTLAVSHEFLNRLDGFPGLSRHYGLSFGDVRGMEHGLAYEALLSGQADVVDTWMTDGKLPKFPRLVLEDDRGCFPPYDAAPLVRAETLRAYPALRPTLQALAFTIDDETMRTLNAAVEEGGGAFRAVAHRFLTERGLIEGDGTATSGPIERVSWWSARRLQRLGALVGQHLLLTSVALGLAILLAVPVALVLTKRPAAARPVLAAAGVIQTIPSLALLAFMIPWMGLGAGAAIAALFLYALLRILRNTYTGITTVAPELTEAARGMGLTPRQITRLIELPLAVPTIMAGIRTSAVIGIGVATLAAFVGAGGLGEPIVTGLQLNDNGLILFGAVPAALLALLVDFLLGRVERWLRPMGVSRNQSA